MASKISPEDDQAIDDDVAELIGEGEWVKDSCYVVYKCPSGKYVLKVLQGQRERWSETIGYIEESEIEDYVEVE